jgi:hypothetical protein
MSLSITTTPISRLGEMSDLVRRPLIDAQPQSVSGTATPMQVSISKEAHSLLEQEQAAKSPLSRTPDGSEDNDKAVALDDFSSPVGKFSQTDAYRNARLALLKGSDWEPKIPTLKSLAEILLEEAGLRKRSTKPVTPPDL